MSIPLFLIASEVGESLYILVGHLGFSSVNILFFCYISCLFLVDLEKLSTYFRH